jgi:hypothetical protein
MRHAPRLSDGVHTINLVPHCRVVGFEMRAARRAISRGADLCSFHFMYP